jgi:hypothetical protein
VLVLSVFLKNGVYRNPFNPAFKRSFETVLIDLVKNGHKTIVQIVFCLRFVPRILEAHPEKNTGISPV